MTPAIECTTDIVSECVCEELKSQMATAAELAGWQFDLEPELLDDDEEGWWWTGSIYDAAGDCIAEVCLPDWHPSAVEINWK